MNQKHLGLAAAIAVAAIIATVGADQMAYAGTRISRLTCDM